MFHYNWVSFAQ